MNSLPEHPAGEFGLLANGSSSQWDIAIDESLDGDNEWLVELEGPSLYLVFQVSDLKVVSDAITFLGARLHGDPPSRGSVQSRPEASLLLGNFGPSPVELVWDNEDVVRCFVIVGSGTRSILRLSLDETDIRMLLESLRQVAEDLCPSRQDE